jgi:hypothetical protein
MALPASGPISGSQIATELGITGVAASNLSLGGMISSSSLSNTNPDEYSEFYGYSHATLTGFTGSASQGGSKHIGIMVVFLLILQLVIQFILILVQLLL